MLCNRLKQCRTARRMTVRELSARSGVPRQAIASIQDAARINKKLLTELKRLRDRSDRDRETIRQLRDENRELRIWRDFGQRIIKAALALDDKKEDDHAEPV